MEIFGWVFGSLLIIIGGIGMSIAWFMEPFLEDEVVIMKKSGEGTHEGDPPYMKRFREAESEFNSEKNKERFIFFTKITSFGILILILMFFFFLF